MPIYINNQEVKKLQQGLESIDQCMIDDKPLLSRWKYTGNAENDGVILSKLNLTAPDVNTIYSGERLIMADSVRQTPANSYFSIKFPQLMKINSINLKTTHQTSSSNSSYYNWVYIIKDSVNVRTYGYTNSTLNPAQASNKDCLLNVNTEANEIRIGNYFYQSISGSYVYCKLVDIKADYV